MHRKLDLAREPFFSEPKCSITRGHPLKVAKPHALSRARRNHWSIRTINYWNAIPADVVMAPSLIEFKTLLDKFWWRDKCNHPWKYMGHTTIPDIATCVMCICIENVQVNENVI